MRRGFTILMIALLLLTMVIVVGCSTGQAYNVPQYGGGGCGLASGSLEPLVNAVSTAVGGSAC